MKIKLLKKLLLVFFLIFQIFESNAQKRIKDQPTDILNSPIGLVITVPLTYPDYQKIQSKLITKLSELGYNIYTVHQWDLFSFNTDSIAKDFKNHNVKYVIHYSDSFGYKILTIYRFSGDENIFDKSSESEFIDFNVGSGDGQINLSSLPKSLSKADRPYNGYDKGVVNKILADPDVPRLINEYPKDLDTSRLIVLKQRGVGAGMMNKKLKEIFDQYPFNKELVVYDSVAFYKKMGWRYVLTCDNTWESYVEKSVQRFYPVIRDMYSGHTYYIKEINSLDFPEVYTKFIEKIKN